MERLASSDDNDVNNLMKSIDKTMNDLKYSCFGKVSVSRYSKEERVVNNLQAEKVKLANKNDASENQDQLKAIDKKLSEALHVLNARNFEKKIEELSNVKKTKGKSAAIYKLHNDILGAKQPTIDAAIMEDPESGEIIKSPEKIKKVSLEYCTKLLTNRAPRDDFKEVMEEKKRQHFHRMQERLEDDIDELSEERFNEALKAVAIKHKDKYKFILKAGKSLIGALFSLFVKVWRNEIIPDTWHNSLLVQLPKSKAKTNNPDNLRHIHVKEEIPKLFGNIVTLAAKDNLVKNMTKFRIATGNYRRCTKTKH